MPRSWVNDTQGRRRRQGTFGPGNVATASLWQLRHRGATLSPMPQNLTPQQKKTLSYERDRRNAYGQNAKASRSAIPRRKAAARRAYRHTANQTLREASFAESPEQADLVEARVAEVVEKPFHKFRDSPLKEHVRRQNERSAFRRGEPGDKARRRRLAAALRELSARNRVQRRAFLSASEKRRLRFAAWLESQRRGIAASARGQVEAVLSRKQSEFDRKEAALRDSFKKRENAAWAEIHQRHGAKTPLFF